MSDDRLKHMAFMAGKEKCVMEQTRLFKDPRRKERMARQQSYDEGYEDGWNAAMRYFGVAVDDVCRRLNH